LGAVEELRNPAMRVVEVGQLQLAVSFLDGRFGAISNACTHVGGPDLHQGARALVDRTVEMAMTLLHTHVSAAKVERVGRKAFGGSQETPSKNEDSVLG
jgi:hypothetical protein